MKKKNTPTQTDEAKKGRVYAAKAGPIHASVFVNKTKEGKEFPSVVISRRYKAADGNWKSSDSYGAKHLKNLAELVIVIQKWFDEKYPDAAGE